MRQRIVSISCLLMAATLMMAQGIKLHQYWIDSDYAHSQSEASSNTTVTFTFSTAGLSSGIHFLNYRALNTDDEWGTLSRTLFYVPEHAAGDADIKSCEYWIDSDYAGRKTDEGGSSITATIDISQLSTGIHFFNYRAVNSFDEQGTLSRTLFYIPERMEEAPVITAYEYWLDEDMNTKVSGTESKDVYVLAMDISEMGDGDHTFFFRAKNSNGDWSTVHTESFTWYKKGDVNGDNEVTIEDAMIVLSYILGENPENFNEAVADRNGDKMVTITDVLIILDSITNQ